MSEPFYDPADRPDECTREELEAAMKIDDGGPAFAAPGMPAYSPEGLPLNPWAGHGWAHDPQPGMSLRDWFAGMALSSMASSEDEWGTTRGVQDRAKWAFEQADAMLAARKEAR